MNIRCQLHTITLVIDVKDNFSCGNRIRALRREHGLSQEALANAAEITPAYLGQVERGQKNPTVLTIERICDALNISLAVFFSEAVPLIPADDEVEKQILGQLNMLSHEEKNIVLQTIKGVMQLRAAAIQSRKEPPFAPT